MEAAQEGHLELVKYLIKSQANVNAQTGTGDTALTYACENGHTDVADELLQHGAELVSTTCFSVCYNSKALTCLSVCYSISFLYYPVYLPHQAKAISHATSLALGYRTYLAVISQVKSLSLSLWCG